MAKRKYTCPHCGRPIRVVSNKCTYNYLYCPDCNLRYTMDKTTGSYISEYEPRNIVKFKGGLNHENFS